MLTLLISLAFTATPDIQPGMWQIDTKIMVDGKEYNPQKMMQEALAQVPEAQRAQMKAMMQSMGKEQGLSISPDLNKVCITQEMISKGEIAPDSDKDCKHKMSSKTAKSFAISFKCKDGTKGDGKFSILSRKSYKGDMKVSQADGKVVDVTYTGKHLATKCQ